MNETTVFIIDDDPTARQSVSALVEEMGYQTQCFCSGEAFLQAYRRRIPSCVITDVRMPGISGLDLLRELAHRKITAPVVVLTAYADTRLTVRAMQSGAVTVLDKPCRDQDLWEAIRNALRLAAAACALEETRATIRSRMASLTLEERQVMDLVVRGKANKVVAHQLHIGLRTVEARRHQVFRKMKADSVAELVRLVLEVDCQGEIRTGMFPTDLMIRPASNLGHPSPNPVA